MLLLSLKANKNSSPFGQKAPATFAGLRFAISRHQFMAFSWFIEWVQDNFQRSIFVFRAPSELVLICLETIGMGLAARNGWRSLDADHDGAEQGSNAISGIPLENSRHNYKYFRSSPTNIIKGMESR